MRPLLIFLLCAAPLTALLAWLDRLDRGGAKLPEEGPLADGPALLVGSDLADPYGQSPFTGAVRRLDGFELRVVEEGYFKLYLRIEQLGRHDGRPRLENVRAAVFDPPKEGKPSLRLTLRAPFVRGDPRALLHAPEEAPRVVTLEGGVEAFDAAGRPLAEVEQLSIDVNGKTVSAAVPLVLRLPERSAEVRAAGLDADLGLRKARLTGPVLASIALASGTVTLRAREATVEEATDEKEIRVVLEGDAEIEQAAGRATCARIDAVLERVEGALKFVGATLSGGVRLEIAPGTAAGIESIEMPSLRIDGQEAITCEGPLHATWKGQLGSLALGERTVRIDAAKARLRLGRAEDGRRLLDSAHFDDFSAADTEGAGSLKGKRLVYAREGSLLTVQPTFAEMPGGRLVAGHLSIKAPEKGAYDVVIGDTQQLSYRAEGRLGPLGDAGQVHVACEGPLRLRARGDRVSISGERDVAVTSDGGASLRCDDLELSLEKKEVVSFLATGNVVASDPSRDAEIRGDEISQKEQAVVVTGSPASVTMKSGRTLRAPTITRREDGTFTAKGGVEVDAPLSADDYAPWWLLKCREASGVLAGGGAPMRLEAKGGVQAQGPQGEGVSGDSFSYDGEKGVATLLGGPARLRRGGEMSLVAPKGLTLRIEEGKIVEGSSLGPATIDYRGQTGGFTRWLADLKGPARFEGDRVVVALGAKLTGFDGEREALVGEAKRVELLLDVSGKEITVREIRGSNGVRVEGRGGKAPAVVTAAQLSCVAGTREVRVAGDAQVAAEGWPRDVRFRELVFVLTKEGIDLKRASDIEVR